MESEGNPLPQNGNDSAKINLDIKDYVDITFKLSDTIHSFWNFYVVTAVAIIAAVLSISLELNWQIKLLATIIYLVHSVKNILALLRSYGLLRVVAKEILSLIDIHSFNEKDLYITFKKFPEAFKYNTLIVVGIHIVADLGVLFVLWLSHVLIQ